MTGDQDVPCDEEAAHSFVWPGRPRAFICESHYKRLVKIADALGLPLDSLDVQSLTSTTPAKQILPCPAYAELSAPYAIVGCSLESGHSGSHQVIVGAANWIEGDDSRARQCPLVVGDLRCELVAGHDGSHAAKVAGRWVPVAP